MEDALKLSAKKKKHISIDCQKEETVRSPLVVHSCISLVGIPETLIGTLFLSSDTLCVPSPHSRDILAPPQRGSF